MKLLIILLFLSPSLLFARGISEGGSSSTVAVPEDKQTDPVYDRQTESEPIKVNDSSYRNSGTKIDKTNSQTEAIDVQLRDSAFDLAQKSSKLNEKAKYYQKLGWATIGAGGSGAYFFWKARNYRKDSRETKKIAQELFDQANLINDVDGSEFYDALPKDTDWLDPVTDVPGNVKDVASLIGDNGKISDDRFLDYLKDEYGLDIDEQNGKIKITEGSATYSIGNEPKLSAQALALLSDEDRKKITQGLVEKKSEEEKLTQKAEAPKRTVTHGSNSNRQAELYRDFLAKQQSMKQRKPSATAAGKVVLYNGEPIGHKYDNLFDMIHRAYEKATEDGLFYPPNTRLNPDGTPRN